MPNPEPNSEWCEIPAGLLDDDPQMKPDKHIFVELKAPWFEIADKLPQYDHPKLMELRSRIPKKKLTPDD